VCSSSLESNGRLRARSSPVHQEVLGNSPLPLGEGRGEGLATKLRKYFFLLLLGAGRKKDGGEFSFLVTQLSPHPNPLPKGEGVYTKSLHPGCGLFACWAAQLVLFCLFTPPVRSYINEYLY